MYIEKGPVFLPLEDAPLTIVVLAGSVNMIPCRSERVRGSGKAWIHRCGLLPHCCYFFPAIGSNEERLGQDLERLYPYPRGTADAFRRQGRKQL